MSTIPQSTFDILQVVPLHRFRTADYLEMIEKGVFASDERLELMWGIITEMSPAGSRHNQFLGQLTRLFASLLNRCEVWIQGTLVVSEGHVYDPDFMLLRRKLGGYKHKLPGPQDVLFILEAAESSLQRDQQIKLPVYAAAGIPEYWIADLEHETLIIHREPEGKIYRAIETRHGDEVVAPLAAPELSFPARQAFE